LVVTLGRHAVAVIVGLGVSVTVTVNVGVAVSTAVFVGTAVGGAPPGMLQASAARAMKKTDRIMFLRLASIRFSSKSLTYIL
jgi:hypothetical protein